MTQHLYKNNKAGISGLCAVVLLFTGIWTYPVQAQSLELTKTPEEATTRNYGVENSIPQPMEALQEIPGYVEKSGEKGLPVDIRREAMKEAALSYGARGGLAARSYEIRKELDVRASYLDKVFNFRQLLIAAPSGFMIEPPIISESLNALLIEGDGQSAAVSDAIYRINENVKIVSAPKNWRTYLERGWGKVEEPPEILRPKNEEERIFWRDLVKKGWIEGYSQGSEVFEEDLNRLAADFDGMVRYRKLLAQGMVSAPFAQQIDRGVTGEAETMRIGDRAVVITGTPQLISGSQTWQPASR
ncbi:MAG TPA: type IV secretory system conjugative DNA transfer family protein [Alphaproteobacteria bacterium]|jgi:defect-in-organelle-trafficking protein DotC|nr:type IV secretory system conjugative DNA transfer family protein [Alphaproteobacteria bacterium]HRK97697.1 type IV secretory system conjugative DNA transfer family protein [Alphaproteobacteria bacterium]